MGDSHNSKPGPRPGGAPPPATGETSPAPSDQFAGKSGRVIHDERGNAVWDWVKETSRIAIDSTSRLLKRLEVPELKVEDTQPNTELSLEAERDPGGGYDPYGGSTPGKGSGSHGNSGGGYDPYGRSTSGKTAGGSGGSSSRGTANAGGSGKSSGGNVGGGYDPYGRDVKGKPTGRKP